ncbi:carbohydrate ABC transporter permease, partial [Micrococcus luteus]|nr:carbohydrate ABC transporter permease [Micrococcus luteus]
MANQQLSPQKAANAPVKKNIVRNRVEPVLFNTFNTVFMIFLV